LFLFAKNQNNVLQDAVYSYQKNPTASPSNIIEVDLSFVEDTSMSFAAVNSSGTLQRTVIVMRNFNQLKNICFINQKTIQTFPSSFMSNLIDSFNGYVPFAVIVFFHMITTQVIYTYSECEYNMLSCWL